MFYRSNMIMVIIGLAVRTGCARELDMAMR